jgi:WD repeat-containing protein mio
METAIRWSPSSTTLDQRFLIADVNGRAFKHCRVENFDGRNLQYETISTHHMVPAFRAFDWSPHDEAIFAVGQWSGEATVLRIDDQSQSLSLPIKHQRLCNAVTFSRAGLLATGLERVRNDFCLNVWDISQRPLTKSSTSSSGRLSMDPVRKLASSEAITSIKFFPSQPDVLVCGVKGASVRIYDTRDHTGNWSFQSQTTCVHNIAIDPLDENYFASAGPLKDTTIHIFDRRSSPSSTAAILGTGSAQFSQQGPILEFKRAFEAVGSSMQANIWSLRYCKGQSGCLAALASTGDYKIFETKKEYTPKGGRLEGDSQTTKDDFPTIAQRIFAKRIRHVEHAFDYPKYSGSEKKRIVSFDFTNLAGHRGRPCAVTIRGDQTIEIYELKGSSSALSISPMGNLAVSRVGPLLNAKLDSTDQIPFPALVRLVSPPADKRIAESIRDARATNRGKDVRLPGRTKSHSSKGGVSFPDSGQLPSREAHEVLHGWQPGDDKLEIEAALNFFTVCRRRAAEGYLLDCQENMEIVSDDPWLQDFWAWVGRKFKPFSHKGPI